MKQKLVLVIFLRPRKLLHVYYRYIGLVLCLVWRYYKLTLAKFISKGLHSKFLMERTHLSNDEYNKELTTKQQCVFQNEI
jgi:hypothetical protein